MPNGGMLPSCFVCKWAKKRGLDLISPVACQQHDFTVWSPTAHVCRDLAAPNHDSPLSAFAEEGELERDRMYAWLEFSYRLPAAPTIPQYHQDLVMLAPFQKYSKWTLAEKEEAYRRVYRMKKDELYP